jgi:flagellar hook protein FlgE
MLRSLFSGVSGMRSHQGMMDVVGNNIANVNTTGFKSSTATFQDLLSQIVSGAGAPTNLVGGTNPAQVGLGSRLSAITTNFSQGALQVTGKSSDLALQGDGFFVTERNGQQMYTRAGSFNFDANGNLVSPDGAFVQGWMADPVTKVINPNAPIGNLTMPPGQLIAPVNTSTVKLGNMLSAGAAIGDTVPTKVEVYDTQGVESTIDFVWTKTAANTWTCDATDEAGTNIGNVTIVFDPATGEIQSTTPATWTIQPQVPAANWPNPITIDFGNPATDPDALKEFGGLSTAQAIRQDGMPAGTLQSFKIGNDGVITGVFSNGASQAVGQIAIASFNNPPGLEKAGNSMYRMSADSGLPQIGVAGTGGRGLLAAGSVEMSNVDLSQEFSNLIVAQRGFQANSKIITTSDDLLQTLINLK